MSQDKVTNLQYLNQTMGGNKRLVKEIMEVFLKQAPEEIAQLSNAVKNTDYRTIKNITHTMKSSASIMGISEVVPMLKEMEDLSKNSMNIEKINELNNEVHFIITAAIREIEIERIKYN